MRRHATVTGRMAADAQGGRAGAAVAVPLLVLDLGRGCDPHQAHCRRCRWRSRWRTPAAQAQAEHARHQLAVHARSRRATRRGPLRLMEGWRRR